MKVQGRRMEASAPVASQNLALRIHWSSNLVVGRPRRKIAHFSERSLSTLSKESDDLAVQDTQSPVVIKTPLPSRTPASLPEPVPIEHSSAYLLQTSKHKEAVEELERRKIERPSETEPFTGNAVEWMLKKVDESLDQVEENPPAYAKAIYEVINGPVGQAASKGASASAKLSVELGSQAVKAAAPVGKWVLTQGFKAAAGAVGYGISAAIKKASKKNDSSK